MNPLGKASYDLDYLERLAREDSPIHRLDPRAKILTTFLFLVAVISLNRYDLAGLLPFFLYPAIIIRWGYLPAGYLLRRTLIVLPFVVLIGIFNPIFDKTPLFSIGDVTITGGWVTFFSIIVRGFLTVLAALVLIATTGFHRICFSLRQLGVPAIFTDQLLFLYRYLFVLLDEASRMVRARALRSFGSRGRGIHSWSSLVGHLLLRTLDRAHRIHLALLARGYSGELHTQQQGRFAKKDLAYIILWATAFALLRFTHPAYFIGTNLEKLLS